MTADQRAPFFISKALRIGAWVSFALNVLIIGTGGAVRLTGSGLGCSQWPLCTPESLVPTPEMGIHGVIEFGNRTLSGPILIFALLVFVLSLRVKPKRKDLVALAAIVLGLVITQAVLGGFVVWFHLDANLVGVHYFLSLVLVAVTAAYLAKMYEPAGPRKLIVSQNFASFTHLTSVLLLVTVGFGILTTGAGPHSGDTNVIRDGFDATLLAHLHSWPGYITLAMLIGLVIWAKQEHKPAIKWSLTLLVLLLTQVAVGVFQSRHGLPPFAVGVHMVLAAFIVAAMTVMILRLKQPQNA